MPSSPPVILGLEMPDVDVWSERVVVALADHSFSAPAARAACVDQIVGFFARMPEPAGARK